jgi:hypothetical protein
VHKVPTLEIIILLARPWEIINLCGLLSHNIDIISMIHAIMSNFDLPNLRCSSDGIWIEPMASEYNYIERFCTLKRELKYFFNYAIIVAIIGAGRTNSGIRGASIGPTLLITSRVKAIPIDIVNCE